jgi:hypothetical protein
MKPLGITFGVNSSYLKHNTECDLKKRQWKTCIFTVTDVKLSGISK